MGSLCSKDNNTTTSGHRASRFTSRTRRKQSSQEARDEDLLPNTRPVDGNNPLLPAQTPEHHHNSGEDGDDKIDFPSSALPSSESGGGGGGGAFDKSYSFLKFDAMSLQESVNNTGNDHRHAAGGAATEKVKNHPGSTAATATIGSSHTPQRQRNQQQQQQQPVKKIEKESRASSSPKRKSTSEDSSMLPFSCLQSNAPSFTSSSGHQQHSNNPHRSSSRSSGVDFSSPSIPHIQSMVKFQSMRSGGGEEEPSSSSHAENNNNNKEDHQHQPPQRHQESGDCFSMRSSNMQHNNPHTTVAHDDGNPHTTVAHDDGKPHNFDLFSMNSEDRPQLPEALKTETSSTVSSLLLLHKKEERHPAFTITTTSATPTVTTNGSEGDFPSSSGILSGIEMAAPAAGALVKFNSVSSSCGGGGGGGVVGDDDDDTPPGMVGIDGDSSGQRQKGDEVETSLSTAIKGRQKEPSAPADDSAVESPCGNIPSPILFQRRHFK